jgi:hypothetical protein
LAHRWAKAAMNVVLAAVDDETLAHASESHGQRTSGPTHFSAATTPWSDADEAADRRRRNRGRPPDRIRTSSPTLSLRDFGNHRLALKESSGGLTHLGRSIVMPLATARFTVTFCGVRTETVVRCTLP